jgi:putative sterol carrier protein
VATLQEITSEIRQAIGDDPGLGKTLKVDLRGDGCIFLDGAAVTNEDRPADCTLDLSKNDFEDLARGRLDPATALMRGRLRVRGDLSVAMKLPALLARARD